MGHLVSKYCNKSSSLSSLPSPPPPLPSPPLPSSLQLVSELTLFNCESCIVSKSGQILVSTNPNNVYRSTPLDEQTTNQFTNHQHPPSSNNDKLITILSTIPAIKRSVSSLLAAVSNENEEGEEPIVTLSIDNIPLLYISEQYSNTLVLIKPTVPVPSYKDTTLIFELSRVYVQACK
jgi:hypothetical protein